MGVVLELSAQSLRVLVPTPQTPGEPKSHAGVGLPPAPRVRSREVLAGANPFSGHFVWFWGGFRGGFEYWRLWLCFRWGTREPESHAVPCHVMPWWGKWALKKCLLRLSFPGIPSTSRLHSPTAQQPHSQPRPHSFQPSQLSRSQPSKACCLWKAIGNGESSPPLPQPRQWFEPQH